MSLYRNIFSKSWKISWHNKYLWFFGLFAALIGGGDVYGFFQSAGEPKYGLENIPFQPLLNRHLFSNLAEAAEKSPFTLIALIAFWLVILALFIFLVWLSVVSQSALVNNSAKIIKGKSADFKEGIKVGTDKFWSVLGLNLINRAVLVVLIFLLGLSVVKIGNWTVVQFALFLLAFILVIIFSFIIKYAVAFVIVKEFGFKKSFLSGIKLFFDNWLVSIEMAIALFFIGFVATVLAVLVILIFTIPFLFLALVFYKLSFAVGFYGIMLIAFIFYFALIFFTGAFLSTFSISSWTGLFLELLTKGGESKIVRIFKKR